ncbi:MAG: hypothetical protein ABEI32_08065, partial [Halothece sp.]
MTDFTSYVFSRSAATRIFGKKAKSVAVDSDRVVVVFTDETTQTTSSKTFKEHFAEHRRQLGKTLSPLPGLENNQWHVSRYEVKVHSDFLTCNCNDWTNQKAIGIKRPCCKHCFSVLYQLGYGKLSEYLKAREEAPETTKSTDATTRRISNSNLPYPSCCAQCPLAKHLERDRY